MPPDELEPRHGGHRNEPRPPESLDAGTGQPPPSATPLAPNPPLSTSKVIAGGMAAATSAVLGSYFGVFGTVGGAAAGSIATTVSTTLYQRSIERTPDTLRTRARWSTDRHDPSPAPATGPSVTGRRRHRPRHPILTLVVATFGLFVVGMALLTGIEWINGGSVFGNSPQRTSVTQVLGLTPNNSHPDRQSDHDRRDNQSGDADRGNRHDRRDDDQNGQPSDGERGHGIPDQIPVTPPDVTGRPGPGELGQLGRLVPNQDHPNEPTDPGDSG
jgi:hypothetical protein